MVKEAAQQKQGGGKPQNKNQGNQPRQQQQPKQQQPPKQQPKQEPAQSNRKAREESQKNAYEDLIRRKEEEIRKYDHEKKSINAPINKAFSLVRNHQNDLDKVPDLSAHWIERIAFLPYLPQDNARDAEDVIQHHNYDISNLLKKDYKHFWSQVLYDETLQTFLDSYLRYCSRPYDTFPTHPCESRLNQNNMGSQIDTQTPLQQALFRRVFITLVRASQYEETNSCHMDKDFFAQHVLKEKKIWDIPKILDFCVLYGPRSREKVSEIIDRLFTVQPDFHSQLVSAVPGMEKALESAVSRITNNDVPASFEDVVDIGTYLSDTSHTIRALLFSLPRLSHAFFSFPSFFHRIAHIYDFVLPVIENTIINPVPGMDDAYIEGVEVVKRNFLEILHVTWQHVFYDYFALKSQGKNCPCGTCNSKNVAEVAEDMFTTFGQFPELSSVLRKDNDEGKGKGKGKGKQEATDIQRGSLVKDMDKFFKLQTSLSKLKGTHPAVDTQRLVQLVKTIREISGDLSQDEMDSKPAPATSTTTTTTTTSTTSSTLQNKSQPSASSQPTSAPVSDERSAQHASLISQVKDLFPDLGDGFVDLALQHYNYETEHLINALLEGSLPSQLESLDRKMALSAPKPKPTPTPSKSTPVTIPETDKNYSLAERRNVFDGDEFDFMARKADASRVYHGKNRDIDLDNRQEKEQVKTYVTQYLRRGELAQFQADMARYEGRVIETNNEQDYDDEYDDSYDEFASFEVGTEGETLNDPKLAKPNNLPLKGEEESDEDEETGEGEKNPTKPGNGTTQQTGTDSNRGRGGKRAGYYKHKTHHRKEKADKKRGFAPVS